MLRGLKTFFGITNSVSNVNLYRQFGSADFITFRSEEEKLMYALGNPSFVKVISIQCDTFSLGTFILYKDGEVVEDHPLLNVLKRPNFFQTTETLLWEWMFWLMLGKSYLRMTGNNINALIPPLIIPLYRPNLDIPASLSSMDPRTILTEKTYERMKLAKYKYWSDAGSFQEVPGSEIIENNDLGITSQSNPSRISALMKIIQNNEKSIDSQNINIRYAGKFMISGTTDINDVTSLPMGEDEKLDIERKSLRGNPVEAVKSMIDIKRYVNDKMFNELSSAYSNTFFQIGNMYNIPRDVLEAFDSSTFENQEKARGAHVVYTLQPKADTLCSELINYFKMDEEGYELKLDYSHLPFMQVFERQRSDAKKLTIDTFSAMRAAGIPLDQINAFLHTDFEL